MWQFCLFSEVTYWYKTVIQLWKPPFQQISTEVTLWTCFREISLFRIFPGTLFTLTEQFVSLVPSRRLNCIYTTPYFFPSKIFVCTCGYVIRSLLCFYARIILNVPHFATTTNDLLELYNTFPLRAIYYPRFQEHFVWQLLVNSELFCAPGSLCAQIF